jgi:hypothetical protein
MSMSKEKNASCISPNRSGKTSSLNLARAEQGERADVSASGRICIIEKQRTALRIGLQCGGIEKPVCALIDLYLFPSLKSRRDRPANRIGNTARASIFLEARLSKVLTPSHSASTARPH